ncbi:MAG: tetratricopeptide repeat protein [Lentisphaerae bacterium]|nr:tetratricopeptide repeat protein [Lentisphaerota bacterium]MCP4100211.1 tetratricopeptide repeat protein [Lentisphaerota bacterium]
MKTIALILLFGAVLCVSAVGAELSSDHLAHSASKESSFSLPENDKKEIKALSSFGIAMLSDDRESTIKWLLSTLDVDPSKGFVLKTLLKNFRDEKSTRKFIPELIDIARHHPQALPLNLAALALANHFDSTEKRRILAENCLKSVVPETLSKPEFNIYCSIAAILCSLYNEAGMFEQADEMLEQFLVLTRAQTNIPILKSAAILYSKAAKESSKERRFLGLLQSPSAEYMDKKEQVITLIEKIPVPNNDIKVLQKIVGFWSKLEKPYRAEGVILDFLSHNPKSTAAKLLLITFYNQNNRGPEAIALQEQMCLEFPSDFNYFRLGVISYDAKYYFKAITSLNWCLLKNPNNVQAIGLMALACYMNSQPSLALAQLNRGKPLSKLDYLRLSCLASAGKFKEAFALFSMIYKKTGSKKLPNMMIFRGFSLADKVKQLDTIEALTHICLNKKECSPELANAAAYTCADNNIMLDSAENLLLQALKKQPDSKEILDSYAWLKYRQGDYKTAEKYIRRTLDKCGKYPNPEISNHAGDIFWKLDKPHKAIKYWELALKVYSRNINIQKIQAKILQAKNTIK